MMTSEAFRARFRIDIHSAMKPNVGSRITHLSWFLPTHVMVDLFTSATFHQTTTFFVFKSLTEEDFHSLIDDGWDSKICEGADQIKCILDRATVVFQYHIGRSTLYLNFQYNRQRRITGSVWEFVEHVQHHEMVKILCVVPEHHKTHELDVGLSWTLSSVRKEIKIILGSYVDQDNFRMCISEGGRIKEKVFLSYLKLNQLFTKLIDRNIVLIQLLYLLQVNTRNEKKKIVRDILPPKVLQVIGE